MANNWGDIPADIAAKIAEHIELYDDYEAFAQVCSTWRFAIKQAPYRYTNTRHTQLPLLMLVDPDDCPYRRYYSLTKCKFIKIDLPSSVVGPDKDHQTRRYFSSHGWLISVSRNNYGVTLFNPFLKNGIKLPEVPVAFFINPDQDLGKLEDWMFVCDVGKFVLSTSPSKADDNDYIVAMIFGDKHQLAFWRPGQDAWVMPDPSSFNKGWFHDVCFFQGEFYAIHTAGTIIAFGDLNDQNKRPTRVVANLKHLIDIVGAGNLYLVEFKPESEFEAQTSCLLVVQREVSVKSYEEAIYQTKSFKVFKLNLDNGKAERVQSLGNRAIFVGYNSTFAVRASTNIDDEGGYGCKADCIYFTDDAFEVYMESRGGSDMGIYSLALGKLIHDRHPFYEGPSRLSLINPPIWVEFSSAWSYRSTHA